MISGIADVYISEVWFAVGMAAILCMLCNKNYVFLGLSTEFTEARAEFLNRQKLPNPVGEA